MEETKTDKHGYLRYAYDDESKGIVKDELVHRHIAYHEIYLSNRDEYSKPFRAYVIHHIDGDKQNNDVSNLQILEREEHEGIHEGDDETSTIIGILAFLFLWIGLLVFFVFKKPELSVGLVFLVIQLIVFFGLKYIFRINSGFLRFLAVIGVTILLALLL